MKFHNVKNLEGFFDAVNKCTGDVKLITQEGDCLNLKSTLCQYVSFAKIMAAGNEVPEIEIIASNKEDIDRLLHFMITG